MRNRGDERERSGSAKRGRGLPPGAHELGGRSIPDLVGGSAEECGGSLLGVRLANNAVGVVAENHETVSGDGSTGFGLAGEGEGNACGNGGISLGACVRT